MLRYSSVEAYYWSKRELKKFRFDFVEFLLNLFLKRVFKIQWLSQLRSKDYKIIYIKSYLLRVFNNTRNVPQFFHIFIFYFIEFSMIKLLNIQ